jgi:hypothetical protein
MLKDIEEIKKIGLTILVKILDHCAWNNDMIYFK